MVALYRERSVWCRKPTDTAASGVCDTGLDLTDGAAVKANRNGAFIAVFFGAMCILWMLWSPQVCNFLLVSQPREKLLCRARDFAESDNGEKHE